VPEINRFFGIRIAMNYDEHLPPHFHARYAEHEAQIVIASGEILEGYLSSRAFTWCVNAASSTKIGNGVNTICRSTASNHSHETAHKISSA